MFSIPRHTLGIVVSRFVGYTLVTLSGSALSCGGCRESSVREESRHHNDAAGEIPRNSSGVTAPVPAEAVFVVPNPDISTFERIVQMELSRVRAEAEKNAGDVNTLGRLGMYYHSYGLVSAAEICYRRAVDMDPAAFRWQYYLGRLLMEDGRAADAVVALEAARAIDPKYVPLSVYLGILYRRLGRMDDSITALSTAIEFDPRSYQAEAELGITLSEQGKTDVALEHLVRSAQIAPYAPAHFVLGNIYRTQGELARASQHFDLWRKSPEVFLRDPLIGEVEALNYSSKVRMRLARQLFQLGRHDEAVRVLQDLLRFYPENADIHIRLAQMYGAMGKADQAHLHKQEADRLLNSVGPTADAATEVAPDDR